MIKLINLLENKMTPAQKKKRGEIFDKLVAKGMSADKAGPIATDRAMEEATFTSKYNDDPKLKGKQKKLPDELQAQLVKNESHLSWPPTQDHEATMAKGELRDMINNAAKVYQMVQPNQQLPGWVSGYITLASDYMHSIAEYLTEEEIQYRQHGEDE
jgi:uncharacterized protein YdaT